MPSSHTPDQLAVAFDDIRAVANAGLLLPATLAQRLGLEGLADELIDLGQRPGSARPGRKLLTLVHAMLAGADSIDDVAMLRAGATARVLGHQVMAPSTCGTFLRAFTFGHIRQLDRLAEHALGRAWRAGAGPGDAPMTIDVDSTICEVHGHHKQGAAYGYTRQLGYHPLLAVRAETGEVLHVRMRTGSANTAGGAERFVNELAGRVRRAGASGPLVLRADSGFWSAKVLEACRRHRLRFSVTVRHTDKVRAAIATIDEAAWTPIDYPDGGQAQVAETQLGGDRLIVRRTRLLGAQATLWPDWRYHALSPTVTATRSSWTSTTAATPWSNWPSVTSRPARVCATAPRAGSWPTPPGWCWPPWPTTCCAGLPRWAWASMGWWSPRRYGPGCSPCLAA
jgi:hypothetical protein